MFDFIEKHWRLRLSLPLLFFIFLILFTSCHTQRQNRHPDDTTNNLTRREYYKQLYSTIQNDETLRSIYTPTKKMYDVAFLLSNSAPDNDKSIKNTLAEKEKQILSHLSAELYTFQNNPANNEITCTWYGNSSADESKNILSNIFCDYDDLSVQEKEYIDYLCVNGLILYDIHPETGLYSLNISKKTTENERKKINSYIEAKTRQCPPYAIKTSTNKHQKISLCFYDPFTANIFNNLFYNLTKKNDLTNSFLSFDIYSNSLSLSITTTSCGNISIPLSLNEDADIKIPCSLDYDSISQGMNIAESFVPSDSKRNFSKFCKMIHENDIIDSNFICALNQNNTSKLYVSLVCLSETHGSINISLKHKK